jgi:hypothetical protein
MPVRLHQDRRASRFVSARSRGFTLKMLIFRSLASHVFFVTNALVQRMSICYMQRAGQVSALPRAVVAELVDAQR